MNNERKEYVFFWYIENYSYCWHQNKEYLSSPVFVAGGLENTAWSLRLYPRGDRETSKKYISLFLERCEDDGPENLKLKCEISVLADDGSTLHTVKFEHTFQKGTIFGYSRLKLINEVLLLQKAYLVRDTLRLCCKIRCTEEHTQLITRIYARTRIGIERISFLHVVENFSSIKENETKTVRIPYPGTAESLLSSSVDLTGNAYCEGKITVKITPPTTKHVLAKCNLYLLNASGIAIKCVEEDNRFEIGKREILFLLLPLTRQAILNRKSKLLPDGKLFVLCDCVFSTGVEYKNVEKILHTSFGLNETINIDANSKSIADEDLSDFPGALDELSDMYIKQFMTDVELKTKTKSFFAHKIVLCARSPVFKAMLSSDMKEKNTDCIQMDDLDDDTVQQLMLFLYSDHLGKLQWETAIKLYYASDKYGIEKLKAGCSSFLKDNLSIINAIELLVLSDTHNDDKLKQFVESFMLENEAEIFGSDEWEKLSEANPKLVIKKMRLKYAKNTLNSH